MDQPILDGCELTVLMPCLNEAETLRREAAGFGALDASRSMRLAIPSATAPPLATFTAFTAFFLSFLRLVGRPSARPVP